jgi:transposase
MNNQTYSEEFKKSSIQKLLSPGNHGLSATARKIGIAPSTLFGWKKKYANQSVMKKSKNNSIANWTPEQKLDALIKTAFMTENELGEYLRSNGLHSSDLEAFKSDSLAGFKSKGRPKLDPEVTSLRKSKKSLERELRQTKSALAEQSARIILLKKSHEIWGVPEDEE